MRNFPGLSFAFASCAVITLGLGCAALYTLVLPNGWIASLIFLPFIAVMAWLSRVTWRQAQGIAEPALLQPEGDALVWRGSRARAWGSYVAAAAIGGLAAGLAVVLVGAMLADGIGWAAKAALSALLAGLLVLFGALSQLLWRNGRGFHGARIVLGADGLGLDLPRWRSLIHRPQAQRLLVPWAQVAGIATRLEAYAPQGMAMINRPYWLLREAGEPVLLFEDRGIDSPQATRSLEPVARAIAARGKGEWIELAMAEGDGGFLGAWFTAPPRDRPAPLPPARVARIRSRVQLTAELGGYAFAIVMLARAIAWLFE